MSDKIQAIKLVRERTGMTLKDAKSLVEELQPLMEYSDATAQARYANTELRNELECLKNDMQTLLRLVGYFVQHPTEYNTFIRTHQAPLSDCQHPAGAGRAAGDHPSKKQ